MSLSNKNALITGSSRGIGLAIVETFAENGANVWACSRSKDEARESHFESLAQKHNVWIKPLYFDMLNEAEVKKTITDIFKNKSAIDILVNNAGVAHGGLLQMTSLDTIRQVFDINFFSQILMIQLVSKLMIRQKNGNIINMASVAGIDADPGYIAYGSSKAAMAFATKTLAQELAPWGIRVNAIAPGLIETSMGEKIDERIASKMISTSALHRKGQPQEIANLAAFLASDESSYITGQVLRIDGGM